MMLLNRSSQNSKCNANSTIQFHATCLGCFCGQEDLRMRPLLMRVKMNAYTWNGYSHRIAAERMEESNKSGIFELIKGRFMDNHVVTPQERRPKPSSEEPRP